MYGRADVLCCTVLYCTVLYYTGGLCLGRMGGRLMYYAGSIFGEVRAQHTARDTAVYITSHINNIITEEYDNIITV